MCLAWVLAACGFFSVCIVGVFITLNSVYNVHTAARHQLQLIVPQRPWPFVCSRQHGRVVNETCDAETETFETKTTILQHGNLHTTPKDTFYHSSSVLRKLIPSTPFSKLYTNVIMTHMDNFICDADGMAIDRSSTVGFLTADLPNRINFFRLSPPFCLSHASVWQSFF